MKTKRVTDRTVLDFPPVKPEWDFWQKWSDGTWEADTRQAIFQGLPPGGRYVDIGAWIGPTCLWAHEAGAEEIEAWEPDPVAHGVLRTNLLLNGITDQPMPYAVTVDGGPIDLASNDWGESESGICRGVSSITVDSYALAHVIDDTADLIKIDVEGAEADYLARGADALRSADCPILLSLHVPFWLEHTWDDVAPQLDRWSTVDRLPSTAGPGFDTLVLIP